MAKWTVKPENAQGNFIGKVEYGNSLNDINYEVYQDVDQILEEVKLDRELLASPGKKQLGWRKAFTVPDITAIEILENHGLDIHDPLFMHDSDKMKKLKYIIKTEYPYLLIST